MSYQKAVTGTRLFISSGDNATINHTAPARIDGGCSIKKDLYVGGNLYVKGQKFNLCDDANDDCNEKDRGCNINTDQHIRPSNPNLNLGSSDLMWNTLFCKSFHNKLFLTIQDFFIDIDKAFANIIAAVNCEQSKISGRMDIVDALHSANDKKAVYLEVDHASWKYLDSDTEIEIKGEICDFNGQFKIKPAGPGYLVFTNEELPLKSSQSYEFLVPEIGQVRILNQDKVRLHTNSTPLVLNNNLTIESQSSTFQQDVHCLKDLLVFRNLNLHTNNVIQFNNLVNNHPKSEQFIWHKETGFHLTDQLTHHDSVRTCPINDVHVDITIYSMIIELHINNTSSGILIDTNVKPGRTLRFVVTKFVDSTNGHTYSLKMSNMLCGDGISFFKLGQTVELLYTTCGQWVYLNGSERQYDIIHD